MTKTPREIISEIINSKKLIAEKEMWCDECADMIEVGDEYYIDDSNQKRCEICVELRR